MVFSSGIFLLYFLPLFLIAYYLIEKRFKNYLILIASIFFYSWGAPKFIFILLTSTFIDFYIVRYLHKTRIQKNRKILLTTSIFLNLGLLAFFKYANFFVENLNSSLSLLGLDNVNWTAIALPIGISFYTFQTLTYSIDVYREKHEPLKKVTDYLLYILSFPQMIAGPIVRFNTIANQIEKRPDSVDDKLVGFYRFCIGLAKKVLIANVMGEQADIIMGGNIGILSSSAAWLGILAYTFQIYFDFSGYSDMAIGLGKMMGFTFPENFNSPYTSTSISEFWRRWHITLGSFMRDYLYIPLGGNRVTTNGKMYRNLCVVFILSGLWHGASWNFVFWGAFHGLFLILDKIFLVNLLNKLGKVPSMFFTFFIVMIGWVFFRLENFDDSFSYIYKLFSFQFNLNIKIIPSFIFTLLVALIFSFITYFKFGKSLDAFFFRRNEYNSFQHILLTFSAILLFILSLSSIASSGFNPFIYFRF